MILDLETLEERRKELAITFSKKMFKKSKNIASFSIQQINT